MANKVTFDGPHKLILCNYGITDLDVVIDIYSKWKEWVCTSSNSKYLEAISCIGGDPLYGAVLLGTTSFLENGWRIKPYAGNHTLTVTGNLYVREGGSPFVSSDGSYNVLISMARSNLVDTVTTGGSSGPTVDQIATGVWNRQKSLLSVDGSVGTTVIKIEKTVNDNQALILGS